MATHCYAIVLVRDCLSLTMLKHQSQTLRLELQTLLPCPRMESTSEANRIHLSKVATKLILNPKPSPCSVFTVICGPCLPCPRMESTSEANRIHLSEVAAKLILAQDESLRPQVVRRPNRQVIKGKGTMRTYWLLLEVCRGYV